MIYFGETIFTDGAWVKISILNDTSRTSNWGCAGTMHGLRSTLAAAAGGEEHVDSVELQPLPFRKIKLLRSHAVSKLASCLEDPDHSTDQLAAALVKLNFEPANLELPDRLYFNGEGDIHSRSGHLVRLLGIAMLYKELGAEVYAVNQSVDLEKDSRAANLVRIAYRSFDFVSVREPCSLRLLQGLGLDNVALVPDAAFSVTPATGEEIRKTASNLGLPARYVCLTGSSDLNAKSAQPLLTVFESLKQITGLPIVMLASTKTDKALANRLQAVDPDVRVVTDEFDYRTAIAVIAGSELLAGGRFHLAIFAAIQGTPIVPFEGNTHKIKGLVELLSYPVDSLDWKQLSDCPDRIRRVFGAPGVLGQLLSKRGGELAKQLERLTG